MRTAKTAGVIAAVCAALAAGLALGARFDLVIAQALHELWQKSAAQFAAEEFSLWYLWGIFAEAAGSLPAYACMPVLGWCLCCGEGRHLLARSRLRSVARFVVGTVLIAAGCITVSCTALHCLNKREVYETGVFGRILWGLLLAAVILLWSMLSRRSAGVLHRGQALGVAWCAFSLVQCGVVQLLKAIWQRTRFDDLLAAGDPLGGEGSAFTGWLQLPGSGGSSFPSGHTAAAGTLLALVLACALFESFRDDEGGWLTLGYGFAAAVGFGRMLIGRHYLSDVCMALLIDSVILLAAVCLFALWQRRHPGKPAQPQRTDAAQ